MDPRVGGLMIALLAVLLAMIWRIVQRILRDARADRELQRRRIRRRNSDPATAVYDPWPATHSTHRDRSIR